MMMRQNVGFDLLELTNPNKKPGRRLDYYACTGSLEKGAIDYLVKHIDNGGGCLFFRRSPLSIWMCAGCAISGDWA